ncbi:TRAP transporter substrate-binding protein [Marinobacter sp. JSM 1782161]|uniref:TRAP transporter substrate-binding protein n=1 Tax=Marinobacter sp. JSM 1782161 TaxID=2685906 RepID=UPI001402653D|nr:TRAP transporter substrate-binding protein [Marinobacter sp. JSM 1782161]
MFKLNRAAAVCAATLLFVQPAAQAAEHTLRLAHWWPANSEFNQTVKAWAESIEEDSNHRLEIQIFPSQTLTKATQSWDSVRYGITDISTVIPGYTANRFPLTEVSELPGLIDSAKQGSCMLQSLYDEKLISKELDETHPLFLFMHGPGHIHTRETPVNTPEDLAGLKVRRPTTVVGEMLEGLGAQPVGMPAPDTYPALQRGVLDGVAMPWEGVKSFRLAEQTGYHSEIGLYSLAFVMTMNKDVYNKLPADLQKVIDDHSGLAQAKHFGVLFDELDDKGRAEAVEAGDQITEIKGTDKMAAWKGLFEKTTNDYLEELKQKGLPAEDVYSQAKALTSECGS